MKLTVINKHPRTGKIFEATSEDGRFSQMQMQYGMPQKSDWFLSFGFPNLRTH